MSLENPGKPPTYVEKLPSGLEIAETFKADFMVLKPVPGHLYKRIVGYYPTLELARAGAARLTGTGQ